MESRRDFLKKAAVAAAGLTIVPSKTIAGLGHKAPSDTMNIVGIGIGGKGHPNLVGMKTENIIGLCDIDWKYAKNCFEEFPDAKRYWDWRKMFDELGAVILAARSDGWSMRVLLLLHRSLRSRSIRIIDGHHRRSSLGYPSGSLPYI